MNRPVALVCYICGRQFGTHSLPIHIKACEKKWENQESLKPPKLRRPCPKAPKGFEDLTAKGKITKDDINKFNAKSFDAFVEEALVQCEYCGRRFNQKSLVPHQKACKTHPMIRKPYVNKGPLGKGVQEEKPIAAKGNGAYNYKIPEGDEGESGNLVACRRCGRKFNPDRVGKHQKVCKGDRVDIKPKKEMEVKQEAKFNMKPNFGKEKKAKWKIQHEELQNAMKMMRKMKAYEAKGGKLSDLPPPPPSNYDHYVQCRHCGRKYAADVAERHIPKCANIINKPGGIKASKIQEKYVGGTGAGSANKNFGGSSNLGSKPNMMGPSKPTSTNSYVKPPTNGNPFGDPYPQQKIANNAPSYGKSSPFEKPTAGSNSKGFVGKVPATQSKIQAPSSSHKPNFSRSNPSNYW